MTDHRNQDDDTVKFPAVPATVPFSAIWRPGHRRYGTRTSWMYVIIVTLWALLCAPMLRAALPITQAGFHRSAAVGMIYVFTVLFIAIFWLNGIKDVIYPVAYRVMPWRSQTPVPFLREPAPLVGLLYVTCNDFSAESLTESIRQEYPDYEVVILDDSYEPGYLAQVDEYALTHGIPVVRRRDRKAFKGGNLNNYLRGEGRKFDYFVIIDSDEILPPYFITRALDYFADPAVGIVQANHVATRNRTSFMRMFAPGVDAHWPAYQLVKAHAGFMSLLGHGAMVSREAYEAAGGFPEIVAEDIGFAIDALLKGYRTEFAVDITCEEEFPPDYYAFKKRHKKWTHGNMEFMRHYSGRILFSRAFKWYERLDIILFTYSLPLTGVFSMYVAVNAVLFPFIGFHYEYPLWMLIPTVISLFAPMINDAVTWRKSPKRRLLSYLGHSMLLFGSMFFVSLFASVTALVKGSVFTVTPKMPAEATLKPAIWHAAPELAAATALAVVVELVTGSVLPVILLLIPVVFMVYLSVMNAGDISADELTSTHILHEDGD